MLALSPRDCRFGYRWFATITRGFKRQIAPAMHVGGLYNLKIIIEAKEKLTRNLLLSFTSVTSVENDLIDKPFYRPIRAYLHTPWAYLYSFLNN